MCFVFAGLSLGAAFQSNEWPWILASTGFILLTVFLIKKILKLSGNSREKILNLNLSSSLLIFVTPFIVYLFLWIPDLIHNQRPITDQHTQMLSYHSRMVKIRNTLTAHPGIHGQ